MDFTCLHVFSFTFFFYPYIRGCLVTFSCFTFTIPSLNSREIFRERKCYSRWLGVQDVLTLRYSSFRLLCLLLPYPMSWSSNPHEQFSNPSSGSGERRHTSHAKSYFPPTLGGDFDGSYGTYPSPDPRVRDSPSTPAAIPLRDYLATNSNL